MKKIKSAAALLLCISFFALLLCGCGENKDEKELFLMDTPMKITLFGKNTVPVFEKLQGTLMSFDRDFSHKRTDGDLGRLNKNRTGVPSADVLALLQQSEVYRARTDGAFSPTLGAVINLWDIGGKNYIPTEDEIAAAMKDCDASLVEQSGDTVTLSGNVQLNLAGVAKGYAADIVHEMLVELGVPRAVVSLGGNVYVHGTKEDGSKWQVGLRDPKGTENDYFATVSAENEFVISSGDYERYFERDGVRYHHIIDPATGAPAKSDLTVVTVVGDKGAQGDAYSTALFVMGRERALDFWRKNSGFELVLLGKDGKITVTEGLEDRFVLTDGKGYTYEIARR